MFLRAKRFEKLIKRVFRWEKKWGKFKKRAKTKMFWWIKVSWIIGYWFLTKRPILKYFKLSFGKKLKAIEGNISEVLLNNAAGLQSGSRPFSGTEGGSVKIKPRALHFRRCSVIVAGRRKKSDIRWSTSRTKRRTRMFDRRKRSQAFGGDRRRRRRRVAFRWKWRKTFWNRKIFSMVSVDILFCFAAFRYNVRNCFLIFVVFVQQHRRDGFRDRQLWQKTWTRQARNSFDILLVRKRREAFRRRLVECLRRRGCNETFRVGKLWALS